MSNASLKGTVSSADLDAVFGSTRGSFLVRKAAGWQLLPPAGSTGFVACAGTGTDPFYATIAAGSNNDIQLNNGSGLLSATGNFNFRDGSQFTVNNTNSYFTGPSSAYGVPVLKVQGSDGGFGSGSTLFDVSTQDPISVFAVTDWGEILLNGAGGLAYPGNIHGVSYINGIANFCAQGVSGDVQLSDGSFGFITDGGVNYDIGLQFLNVTGGIYASYLQLGSPLDTIYGGTGGLTLTSSTYVPTFTNVANISANTNALATYMQFGNTVLVSGKVSIDPTSASTLTKLGISVPVASNFSNLSDCCGTAATSAVAGYSASILADTTNDRAQLEFTTGADVANRDWYFIFAYTVI